MLKGGRWLFTYAEPAGTFATTDKPETIPEAARGLVRVIEPTEQMKGERRSRLRHQRRRAARRREGVGEGDVARGLRDGGAGGAAGRRIVAVRGTTGAASGRAGAQRRAIHPAGRDSSPRHDAGGDNLRDLLVRSLSRRARVHDGAKIPFADKDIERDPAAAQELDDKASKMGIPTDRVPVIDVRGRLLLGFDRERIEALLGQPT